jgi:hypothetical protein
MLDRMESAEVLFGATFRYEWAGEETAAVGVRVPRPPLIKDETGPIGTTLCLAETTSDSRIRK